MYPRWMNYYNDNKEYNQMFILKDGKWEHTCCANIAQDSFDKYHGIKGTEAVRVVKMLGKDIKYWADEERNWNGYEPPKADELERYKLGLWKSKTEDRQKCVAVFKIYRRECSHWSPYSFVGYYGEDYMNALAEDMFELGKSEEWVRLSHIRTFNMTKKQLFKHQQNGYKKLMAMYDGWAEYDYD